MTERAETTGRVAGKVALVAGAASGIGRATALLLAAQGAEVYCADLNESGTDQTVAELLAGGARGWSCHLDVTQEASWQETLARPLRERGRVDIVVNSAGISHACPLTEMPLQDWRRVLEVNLDGAFLGTKQAVLAMRQSAQGGCIINVASVSGLKAQPQATAYCASKAALILFSRAAALECSRQGDKVRINCVSPAGVKTPLWETMPFFQELVAQHGSVEGAFGAMAQWAPHSKWALPQDVAAAILYLASDEAAYVTGTNLVFDHGELA